MTEKTINISLTETQHADVKAYANENGISIEQAITALTTGALRTGKLMSGVITEISPAVQEAVKTLQLEALKQYDEQKATVAAPAPMEVAVNEDIITFKANADVREIIAEINKVRVLKGLAPLESSLCELLLHWAETMGDYSSFANTTGLEYSWYKSKMAELALAEREANGAKSNVIVTKGIFSSHTIVDTPAVATA